MITNIKSLEKYCIDYKNIENYEEAVKSPLRYDLHHRREISENKSRKQLIAENLYYGRPPEELVFLEHGEHMRLHQEGDKNPLFGQHRSAETRQKIAEGMKGKHPSTETRQRMSNAKKNMSAETRKKMSDARKGKPKSVETKQKMSDAKKGKRWHLENGRRIWTD